MTKPTTGASSADRSRLRSTDLIHAEGCGVDGPDQEQDREGNPVFSLRNLRLKARVLPLAFQHRMLSHRGSFSLARNGGRNRPRVGSGTSATARFAPTEVAPPGDGGLGPMGGGSVAGRGGLFVCKSRFECPTTSARTSQRSQRDSCYDHDLIPAPEQRFQVIGGGFPS